jgi:hypothetical protein
MENKQTRSVEKKIILPWTEYQTLKSSVLHAKNPKSKNVENENTVTSDIPPKEENESVSSGLSVNDSSTVPIALPDTSDTEPPDTDIPERLSDELILTCIPHYLKNKAKAILGYLNDHVTWNGRGELICQDQVVPHSHIGDLIRDSLHQYRKFDPCGARPFYKYLANIDTPINLICNPRRQAEVQYFKQNPDANGIPPPPGTYNVNSKKRTGQIVKWINL